MICDGVIIFITIKRINKDVKINTINNQKDIENLKI